MFAGRFERPLLLGGAVAVAAAGSAASLVPVGLLAGQTWYVNAPYLGVALMAVVACRWRGLRSTGRYRYFWLIMAASMAVWSLGEACFMVLNAVELYTFPSLIDLFIVGSNVLVCLALLVYPSEPGITRLRRLMDSVMTTIAAGLLMWQLWLGPLVAAADRGAVLLNVASIYFPVAGTLMLVFAVVTLTHAPPRRAPLAVVTIGYVFLAIGGIWYANMQTDGNGLRYVGFVWNIVANACLVFAPLLRTHGSQEEPRNPSSLPTTTLLPYAPLTLALGMSVVSYLNHSAGPIELLVSLALVGLLLTRQYLSLRQNVALTRLVQVGQDQLRHQALHDGLTGLPNRTLFADRLGHALASRARATRRMSLLYADLDGFKTINDTLGHTVGDQLLSRVAERMRTVTRTSDTLARLGGDEFAVLTEDGADPLALAERMCEVLRLPFDIESQSVRIGCSVGVVELTDVDVDVSPDVLLTRADVAMYQAKRSGRGGVVRYREGMSLIELEDRRFRDVLEAALEDGSFRAAFQPIVEISTGRAVAVEALARLRHDSVDMRPEAFIAVAERTGILPALTEAILREACAGAGALLGRPDEAGGVRAVHVNVLPSQIESPALLSTITDVFASERLRPGQLVLEIAETALGSDVTAFGVAVARLRAAGVRIALDDFGFGHSSLSRLGEIEVDILKVDPSVLDDIDTNPRQLAIMDTLLGPREPS